MNWFKRKPLEVSEDVSPKPSEEAIQARIEAHSIVQRADTVFTERDRLVNRNHFGERIRRVYEGMPGAS